MSEQTKTLQRIIERLPYVHQIQDIELSNEHEVTFSWRGVTLRVSNTFDVDEIQGTMEIGSNLCIVLKSLLIRS